MGVLRKIGKWFLSPILIILIILTIFLHGLVEFTKYENLRSASYPFFESQLKQRIRYEEVSAICQLNESIEFEVGDLGHISVPCSEVKEGNFLQPFVYAIFDKLYYKEYSCEFSECVKQTPLVVLSAYANSFFASLQIYMIIGTISFAVLYLLVSENMKERFRGLGSILTFCGIQFFIIMYMLSLMNLADIREMIDMLFSSTYIYFGITAVCGVVLLISSLLFNEKTLINKK